MPELEPKSEPKKKPSATRLVLQHTATQESAPHAAAFRDFWMGHFGTYELTAEVATGGRPRGPGHHLWFKRTDPADLEGIRAARDHHGVALRSLGLEHLDLSQSVSDLSGGERAKVALARSLVGV